MTPEIPDAAKMSDEAIVALVLKETTPEDYKRYAPSVLALWRPRFDAAADLAYRVGHEQGEAKGVADTEARDVCWRREMAHRVAQMEEIITDERAATGALVSALQADQEWDDHRLKCKDDSCMERSRLWGIAREQRVAALAAWNEGRKG